MIELKNVYIDTKKKLIPLIMDLRDRENEKKVTKKALNSIFKGMNDWEKVKQATGHATYKNEITKITVAWQNHSKKKDKTIPQAHLDAIKEAVQRHVNILGNEIFGYKVRNWKSEPDFKKSENRLAIWTRH